MRALLIHNPTAGRRTQRRELPETLAVFRDSGWTVVEAHTQGPGHASQLACEASAQGYEVVLVAGGDGTINQAADGLMAAQRAGHAAAILGILPAGTANVLAQDLDLPAPGLGRSKTLPAAARELLRSGAHWLDVGRASNALGSRTFLCWAGIGLDAAVTRIVEDQPAVKQWLGPAHFAAALLREVNRPERFTRFIIEVDGETWEEQGSLAVASNIRHYATFLDLAPGALLDDGLLDFTFVRAAGLLELARLAPPMLAGEHLRLSDVRYAQARRIVVRTAQPQPMHLDAEPFGVTPVTLEVVPRALQVLMPPTAAARRLVRRKQT